MSGQLQRTRPIKSGMYVTADGALALRYRRVRRLVEKTRKAMPWLDAADEPAVRAWAELEILAAGAFMSLTTDGMTNAQGEPRRLLSEYRQLRQAQLAYERDLGMTPAARAGLRIGDSRARALDTAAELAEGRRLRLAAEARIAHDGSVAPQQPAQPALDAGSAEDAG